MPTLGEAWVLINGKNDGLRAALADTHAQTQATLQRTAADASRTMGQAGAQAGQSFVSRFVSGLGQIGLAAMGGQAIIGGAKGLGEALGVGLQMELEDTRAQFMAFYKDGAVVEKTLADIRVEANKTPFTFQELSKAAAGLGPAAKQADMPLMDLIRDAEVLAASNPAQGLEGAAFALREAVSGDFTSIIERFNLPRSYINDLRKQGVPDIEIVRRAMKSMGYDMDLVSAKSKTLSGRWSTFLDAIDTVRLKISQPIFDALGDGLDWIAGLLNDNEQAVTDFANAIAGGFTGAIDTLKRVGRAIGDVLGYLDPNNKRDLMRELFGPDAGPKIDEVVRAIKRLTGGIAELARSPDFPAFAIKLQQMTGVDLWPLVEEVKALGDTFKTGGFGAAAAQLQAWLAGEWAKIDWNAVWKTITVTAETVGRWLGSAASGIASWLAGEWAKIDWNKVWSAVVVTSQTVGAWLSGAATAIGRWLGEQWAQIDWSKVWGAVTITAATVASWFVGAHEAVLGWIADLFGGAKPETVSIRVGKAVITADQTEVTTAPAGGEKAADNWLAAFLNKVKEWEQPLRDFNFNLGSTLGKAIVDGISATFGLIWQAIQGIFSSVQKHEETATLYFEAMKQLFSKIIRYEGAFWEGLFSGLFQGINGLFQGAGANAAETFWENFQREMMGHNWAAPGPSYSPAPGMQIPETASGTPYWRGGLTWVGERGPELLNLPRGAAVYSNAESRRMAGGVSVTQNFYGAADAAAVRTAASDGVRSAMRALGAA